MSPIRGAVTAVGRLFVEPSGTHATPAAAIAVDDTLVELVGRRHVPSVVRVWENARAVVLPDWRLDLAPPAVRDAAGDPWPVCGRSSGGSLVAHGSGVVNVSLVLPVSDGQPSIEECYELWIDLVGGAVKSEYGVEM